MFIAAFVATQHDPDAMAYYQRKRAEGKEHNAAVAPSSPCSNPRTAKSRLNNKTGTQR